MVKKQTVDSHLLDQKGLYFHASSVDVSGKALLFLGHSSAGKSTISRLLSEQYPIIADDKVWVFQKKSGDWLVCDGDGDSPIKEGNIHLASDKKHYPLLAVLRIFKSKTMGIKPITPKETCRYLVDAVFEVDKQRIQKDLEIIKQWFASTAEISKKINGWSLTFQKNKSIIEIIHENIEEEI